MIDIEAVKKQLELMGDFDESISEKLSFAAQNAAEVVFADLKDKSNEADARIIRFAAAKAFYSVSLTGEVSDGVQSFTAGDIMLTKSDITLSYAKEQMIEAKNDCRALLCDRGFAFYDV